MSSPQQQQGAASDVFSRPPPRQSTADHPLLASPSSANAELQHPQQQHGATIVVPPPPSPASAPFPATSPGVTISMTPASPAKSLDDLVDDFVQHSQQPPPPPLPASMPPMERLVLLMQRRAWEEVLRVCQNLLQGSSSHYAPLYEALLMGRAGQSGGTLSLETHQRDLVFVMHSYIQALTKVGNYHHLVLEMERWSFVHHNDRSAPDWIPWSLHIAAAAALQYVPKEAVRVDAGGGGASQLKAYKACLDALWAIRSDLLPEHEEAAAMMQVENAIANVFTAMKEWRMVLLCYQRMMDVLPFVAREEAARLETSMNLSADSTVVVRALELVYKTELLSRQGRILLQAGALDSASQIFAQASNIFNETLDESSKDILSDHAAILYLPALLTANDGLYQFSLGQYDQAMELFQATIESLRNTTPTPAQPPSSSSTQITDYDAVALTTTSRENLYSETTNNMALAALYTCRLADALQLMESLIQEDVTAHLTARVALNLCTLYELASESPSSARKKRILQLVAKRFCLQDIPAECFRVN